jgi:hypothetical protein
MAAKKNAAAAALGRKGGAAGTGKSKVRGDSEYYKKLALKRRSRRKAR